MMDEEQQTREEHCSRNANEGVRNSKKSSHRSSSRSCSPHPLSSSIRSGGANEDWDIKAKEGYSNEGDHKYRRSKKSSHRSSSRSSSPHSLSSSIRSGGASEDRDIKAKERASKDREAKRRAARRFKDDTSVGVAAGKTASKKGVIDHSPSRNNKNAKGGRRHRGGEDTKKDWSRGGGGDRPLTPGAVASNGREDARFSSKSSGGGSDREAKNNRSRKGANTYSSDGPGAESAEDLRRSRKESREIHKNNKKAPVALLRDEDAAAATEVKPMATLSEDGFEGVLEEMVEDDQAHHQREQGIRSMEQEQANNDNNENGADDKKRTHIRTLSLFFCMGCCMGCCFILVIGGVLYGAEILSFSPAEETKVGSDVTESPTKAPSSVVEIPDVANLTDSPTSAPTFFVYDPISPDQCTAIANGDTIGGQEDMIEKNFALILDSQLLLTMESPILLETIHQKIQEVLAPKMAGCDDNDDVVINRHRRHRRSLNAKDHDELKYIIGNLVVTRVVETGEDCSPASAGTICIGMRVEIGIFARGNDLSTYDYIGKLSSILNGESNDLVIELTLNETLFRKVILVRLLTLDSTPTPTIPAPTTDWPSVAPTVMASSNPSFMPVQSPVTSEPRTRAPTKVPITPSPTRPDATANPTRMATPSPTKTPSRSPSGSPSETPSLAPTSAPSVAPSSQPTYGPTTNPSSNPSRAPSSVPSSTPTNSPSKTLSSSPSYGPLADDLYCGCITGSWANRGPDNLTQQDCILYCRDEGHNFALAVNGAECWCGDSNSVGGESYDCNTACLLQGPGNCYDDLASCTCGGSGSVSTLFRTSPSLSCPTAGLLRSDYATATWTPTGAIDHPPMQGIDGNIGTFTVGNLGTPEQHAVYLVDLGFVAAVTKIRIRNRPNCVTCLGSMNGFTLELLDGSKNVISGTSGVLNEVVQPSFVPTLYDFVFSGITGVRYIRLEAPNSDRGRNYQFTEIHLEGVAHEQ